MIRTSLIRLLSVLACTGCSWDWDRYVDHKAGDSVTCATGVSAERLARLSRGVDLYGWFEPSPGAAAGSPPASFATFISDADLGRLAQAGFGFVRASFYYTDLFNPAQPDQLNQANLVYFGQAIERTKAAGLGIVFVPYLDDQDAFKQSLSDPMAGPAARDQLFRMWSAFGKFLAGYDPDWVFPELMGVPDFADSATWNEILVSVTRTVRSVAPAHTIIVDGNSGAYRADNNNSVTAFSALEPVPGERNVIYGFIFFDPVIFTHQGATWRPEWPELEYVRGLPYPSSPALVSPALGNITNTTARAEAELYGLDSWGPGPLAVRLQPVAEWSARNCARVMSVEFGVYRPNCPSDSAARWVTDVRTWFEQHRIGWSYWSYDTQFVLAGPAGGPVIDPGLGAALGIHP
jgi:endoglucanase